MAQTPNGIVYMAETDSADVSYWQGQQALSLDPSVNTGKLLSDAYNTVGQPLTSASTNYTVGGAGAGVALTSARHLRIYTVVKVVSAATGQYSVTCGWNSGAFNLPTATVSGSSFFGVTTSTGAGGAISMSVETHSVFAAGTWVFYPVIQRTSGGSGTDSVSQAYIAVYDAGPA